MSRGAGSIMARTQLPERKRGANERGCMGGKRMVNCSGHRDHSLLKCGGKGIG